MTLPSIILGLLISLLMGALFHLWRDGGLGRLMFFLALSVAGFACGQWVGVSRNWMFFPVGPLDLGPALLGSFVFLGVGYWLSLVKLHRPGKTKDEV